MAEETVAVETAPTETPAVATESSAPASIGLRAEMAKHLPEGQETPAWWGKYESDESMFNGVQSQASMVGKKGDIPQEGCAPEAYGEFGDKMGWKESSEIAKHIDLDAGRFGDSKADLDAAYNGGIHDVANKIMANLRTNPSKESVISALVDYCQGDAESTLLGQAEAETARTESLNAFAASKGLTAEAWTQQESELMAREGWDNNTDVREVLHSYLSKITNSQTVQDAQLHNTTEGLDQQLETLRIDLMDVTIPPAQHKINLEKQKALLERKGSLMNK